MKKTKINIQFFAYEETQLVSFREFQEITGEIYKEITQPQFDAILTSVQSEINNAVDGYMIDISDGNWNKEIIPFVVNEETGEKEHTLVSLKMHQAICYEIGYQLYGIPKAYSFPHKLEAKVGGAEESIEENIPRNIQDGLGYLTINLIKESGIESRIRAYLEETDSAYTTPNLFATIEQLENAGYHLTTTETDPDNPKSTISVEYFNEFGPQQPNKDNNVLITDPPIQEKYGDNQLGVNAGQETKIEKNIEDIKTNANNITTIKDKLSGTAVYDYGLDQISTSLGEFVIAGLGGTSFKAGWEVINESIVVMNKSTGIFQPKVAKLGFEIELDDKLLNDKNSATYNIWLRLYKMNGTTPDPNPIDGQGDDIYPNKSIGEILITKNLNNDGSTQPLTMTIKTTFPAEEIDNKFYTTIENGLDDVVILDSSRIKWVFIDAGNIVANTIGSESILDSHTDPSKQSGINPTLTTHGDKTQNLNTDGNFSSPTTHPTNADFETKPNTELVNKEELIANSSNDTEKYKIVYLSANVFFKGGEGTNLTTLVNNNNPDPLKYEWIGFGCWINATDLIGAGVNTETLIGIQLAMTFDNQGTDTPIKILGTGNRGADNECYVSMDQNGDFTIEAQSTYSRITIGEIVYKAISNTRKKKESDENERK